MGVFSRGTTRISGSLSAAPGKSCLHARGEKERVIVLESWEGTRASSNKVRVHRGLEPLENTAIDENTGELVDRPLTLQHINDERFKEYIGEGQLFFNMKRLNEPITSYDGAKTYEASKSVYVVPVPDIEKENRY